MQNQLTFKGLLYGKNSEHVTKPVMCCHHGDAKIVKLFNNSSQKSPRDFFEKNKVSFYEKEGVTSIKIITEEIPEFNFLEKLFFDISSLQKKLIKKRKENVFTELVFHMNEFEFEYLKKDYLYISKKQLEAFKTFLLQHVKPAEKKLAEKFLR